MPYRYGMYIDNTKDLDALIKIFIFDKKKIVREINTGLTIYSITSETFHVSIKPALPTGKYYFQFGIEVPGYNATHNSEKINLIVE